MFKCLYFVSKMTVKITTVVSYMKIEQKNSQPYLSKTVQYEHKNVTEICMLKVSAYTLFVDHLARSTKQNQTVT